MRPSRRGALRPCGGLTRYPNRKANGLRCGCLGREAEVALTLAPVDFERRILAAVQDAARDVLADGRASLHEGEDGGGAFLELRPRNTEAASVRVYPDYRARTYEAY